MKSIHRRGRPRVVPTIAALVLALVTTGGALAGPAAAHDGVDHSAEPGAQAALDWSNYEKITLTKDTGEPIDMAVMPDGKVLTTARNGDIRLTDPDAGTTKVVTTVPVYSNSEDGMQTVSLAPDFATSKWVYLYYAPRTMTAPYPTTTPAGRTAPAWLTMRFSSAATSVMSRTTARRLPLPSTRRSAVLSKKAIAGLSKFSTATANPWSRWPRHYSSERTSTAAKSMRWFSVPRHLPLQGVA